MTGESRPARAAIGPSPPDVTRRRATRVRWAPGGHTFTMSDSTITACPSCGKKNRVPAAASGAPRCAQCHSPLPWLADADDRTYEAVVEATSVPVLVDLWAPWCGPCRTVSPVLEALARSHAGRVKLVKVNVDESPRTAQRFAVQGIPTLLVLHRGELVARQTGAAPEHVLRPWLDDALAKVRPSGSDARD
jgi:thioredoxin 2